MSSYKARRGGDVDSGLCARLGGVMNLTPLGSVAIDFAATHYRWTADWVGGGDKLRKFFSGKGHNLRRVKASKFVKQVKGAAKEVERVESNSARKRLDVLDEMVKYAEQEPRPDDWIFEHEEGDAAAAPAAEIEEAPKKKAKTAKPRLVPTSEKDEKVWRDVERELLRLKQGEIPVPDSARVNYYYQLFNRGRCGEPDSATFRRCKELYKEIGRLEGKWIRRAKEEEEERYRKREAKMNKRTQG